MINKVILIGNLGADPEIRYTQNGTPVATFNIATTETWRNKDGGKEEHTEWHRIVVWGKMGETCGEYLNKGSKVYVEGKIRSRKWQDRDGNDRYTTEINAQNVQFLTPRGGGSASGGFSSGSQGSYDPGPSYSEPPPGVGDDVPF